MGGTAKSGTLAFVAIVAALAACIATPSKASALPSPSPAPRAATIIAKASAAVVDDEESGKDKGLRCNLRQ